MQTIIDENLSKRIISLRFLLIAFVVFVHNNPVEVNFAGYSEIYEIPVYVDKIRTLLSDIITRVAVPLFFLVAGYLLYAKENNFFVVLKKKTRAILVPYITWNILGVLFFFIAQTLPFTKPYFANLIIRDFGIIDWIDVFWGKLAKENHSPLIYQFWFLRDLFILCLLFLVIKKIIDKFPFGFLAILFILWILNADIYVVSPEALLFFTLGYYVVKYSLSISRVDRIKMYDIVSVYVIGVLMELFMVNYIPIIHKINILIGSLLLLKLTWHFIHNQKLYALFAWLENYAFFVYAIHGILLTILTKLSVKIIPMHGGWILVQYFSVNITGLLLCLISAMAARKISPPLYAILTGGRVKNSSSKKQQHDER
jgi:hypothetical protein